MLSCINRILRGDIVTMNHMFKRKRYTQSRVSEIDADAAQL